MSKPWIHSLECAKKFGGKPEDYMDLNSFLDSSKGTVADSRHRALTHTSWFISVVIPRVFGETAINSDGKVYSTRDVAECHVISDYKGFIPSAQDFLAEMEYQSWMNNGNGVPPSCAKLFKKKRPTYVISDPSPVID